MYLTLASFQVSRSCLPRWSRISSRKNLSTFPSPSHKYSATSYLASACCLLAEPAWLQEFWHLQGEDSGLTDKSFHKFLPLPSTTGMPNHPHEGLTNTTATTFGASMGPWLDLCLLPSILMKPDFTLDMCISRQDSWL